MSTLEEEIQQSVFTSHKQKAILNIVFTANWLKASQIRLFKQFGISPEQYNVLRILRGQKGNAIGINKIQDRMLDKNSNASRLVDKLKEKQLVNRVGCKEDRRQVEIFISNAGMELLASLDDLITIQENKLNLSNHEAETLNQLLNKLRINN